MISIKDDGYNLLEIEPFERLNSAIDNIVILDKDIHCRLDILATANYGTVRVLPLLLDWNCITDEEDTQIGDMIILPNMNFMLNNCKDSSLFEEEELGIFDCPGFIKNDHIVSNRETYHKGAVTVANSKLKIAQNEAVYNPETGIIVF